MDSPDRRNRDNKGQPAEEQAAKQKKSIFKKLHRWPGLIISFVLLYYGITGIFMNHREFFSGLDMSRNFMPPEYRYKNWNNASLKGTLRIDNDSILVWGNIGIWVTDSSFTGYRQMNDGFSKGTDNRRIADVHRSSDGHLYAAALFGLYTWDSVSFSWKQIAGSGDDRRFTAVESIGDTVYALSRSYLYRGLSHGPETRLIRCELPAPAGYENKTGWFETMWQIHSGEIFGLPGKLFVDLLGLITVFLSVTGIMYFFFPDIVARKLRMGRKAEREARVSRWSLKWHNKAGEWFFVFLVILFFSGIFLRPPLLIAIAEARVKPLKFTNLDQPNPWYDKLRDIVWDSTGERFVLSALDGMYVLDSPGSRPVMCSVQPPVSVMGINVLEPAGDGNYIIGSFSGLFLWNPFHPVIIDIMQGRPWSGPTAGRPVGDFKVSGMATDAGGLKYMADYDLGMIPVGHSGSFPPMPENITEGSGISLWSVALEIHTGRIFNSLIGPFYILVVPLAGLTGITVVISGYMLWRKKYRRRSSSAAGGKR